MDRIEVKSFEFVCTKSKLNRSAGVWQEKQILCDHKKCAPLDVTLLCHSWMLKFLVSVDVIHVKNSFSVNSIYQSS